MRKQGSAAPCVKGAHEGAGSPERRRAGCDPQPHWKGRASRQETTAPGARGDLDEGMEELFSRLQELVTEDHPQDEEALGVITEILQKDPEDADALNAKLVCLINLRNFDAALSLLTTKSPLAGCHFERGYVLYRLNRQSEALDELTKCSKDTPGVSELRAQVLYRLGRYSESAKAYETLDSEAVDPAELAANRAAALTAAGDGAMAEKVITATANLVDMTPDMAYNKACSIIERGEWKQALKALDEAESLFVSGAEEDGEPEEVIADGRIVFTVQRAYISQRTGLLDAALEGYETALKAKPGDAEVAAVASNNLFSVRGKDTNMFDTAKKAKALNVDDAVEAKLTVPQRRVFALNRCLLALYMNKIKECTAALSKLEKEFEGSELPALVRAALLAREKKMEEATALLREQAESNPKAATQVKLTLAQIQLGGGDRRGAIETLESIEGASGMLGVVGSIVKIAEGFKDPQEMVVVLERAIEAAKKVKEGSGVTMRLLALCADMHTRNGDEDRAVKMLEQLVVGGEKEPAIIARLVKACAESDVSKAEKYANMLPELDSGDVDVQELESFQTVAAPRERDEVPEGAGGTEGAGGGGGDGAAGVEAQQKKRSKAGKANRKKEKAVVVTEDGRKVVCEAYKLPAKYEMLVEIGSWGKPDPERWLPWYQRSYNKKLVKKRKGANTASGGAQGGAVSAKDAALDRGEKFTKQLEAQAAGEGVEAASPAAGGGSASKSGKKGRKKK